MPGHPRSADRLWLMLGIGLLIAAVASIEIGWLVFTALITVRDLFAPLFL